MRPSEVPLDAVQEYAVKERVCIRPLLRRVMDLETGEAALVALPCQSTRESRCPSCAARARALRMHQCIAGWHLEEEPDIPVSPKEPRAEEQDGRGRRHERSQSIDPATQ